MEPYDRLIAILEAFIENFDGRMRVRGVQTALLIQQASAAGTGISFSEIARRTGAPLENVRRHTTRAATAGTLIIVSDPDDDRASRLFIADRADLYSQTAAVVQRLAVLANPVPTTKPARSDPSAAAMNPPFAELISILQAFIDGYGGGLRIRGIKTALLIQRSTLDGTGITITELARQTNAPAETVRRAMKKYVGLGILCYQGDPDDDRKVRIKTTDPAAQSRNVNRITAHLAAIDWARFQLLTD